VWYQQAASQAPHLVIVGNEHNGYIGSLITSFQGDIKHVFFLRIRNKRVHIFDDNLMVSLQSLKNLPSRWHLQLFHFTLSYCTIKLNLIAFWYTLTIYKYWQLFNWMYKSMHFCCLCCFKVRQSLYQKTSFCCYL